MSTGGFIFGGAISADESSGFKFGMANEISATSASSAGFQVPASGTYKFKFGTTVSSCASTASSGFVFGRNEKLFHQTMPFSGFKFASSASGSQTKDSSFVFGTAQQSSEQRCTGSGLLEKLLESDKPDTSNEPIMFPEHADVASIKPSFQSMLGHVTSPAGVGDNHEGFQFTFSLQKDKQVMQQPQVLQQVQPKSPRSPDVEANGYYVNKVSGMCITCRLYYLLFITLDIHCAVCTMDCILHCGRPIIYCSMPLIFCTGEISMLCWRTGSS